MSYTQLIIFSAILNIGQAYIIYLFFIENRRLRTSLKEIKKQVESALKIKQPVKKSDPPKSKSFWNIKRQ